MNLNWPYVLIVMYIFVTDWTVYLRYLNSKFSNFLYIEGYFRNCGGSHHWVTVYRILNWWTSNIRILNDSRWLRMTWNKIEWLKVTKNDPEQLWKIVWMTLDMDKLYYWTVIWRHCFNSSGHHGGCCLGPKLHP